ncbi:MAG: glycine zipper family protein [Alphaproteobacteria bacterium]
MKRFAAIGAALGLFGLTACAGLTPSEQRAVTGTAAGAAGGAAIGAAAGDPGVGAGIGAGVGLLGGLIADQAARDRERYYYRDGAYYYDEGYYDRDGNWHWYDRDRGRDRDYYERGYRRSGYYGGPYR